MAKTRRRGAVNAMRNKTKRKYKGGGFYVRNKPKDLINALINKLNNNKVPNDLCGKLEELIKTIYEFAGPDGRPGRYGTITCLFKKTDNPLYEEDYMKSQTEEDTTGLYQDLPLPQNKYARLGARNINSPAYSDIVFKNSPGYESSSSQSPQSTGYESSLSQSSIL